MAYIDVSAVTGVTLLAGIDPDTRDMFLSANTVGAAINPIDIYKEMRTCRSEIETLRPYDVFLSAFGNVPKGGGKFTERYVQCNSGTRIVPFDISHELTITGTIITDDGQEGIACFDRTTLTVSTIVDINYIPPQVEIIEVSTGGGGGATAQEIWEYATRSLTTSAAVTAQDIIDITDSVWTNATRTLTEAAGVTAQDITDIADAVWDEPLAGHTSAGSAGEQLGAIPLSIDTAGIASAVWSNVSRTLTTAAGVTAQNIIDIVDAVWDEDLTAHNLANSASEQVKDNFIDADELSNIASAVWGSASRTLTSIPNIASSDIDLIAAAVWTESIRSLTATVDIDATNLNAIINGVWTATTRSLTAPVDITTASEDNIQAKVWTNSVRTITGDVNLDSGDITNIAAQVWANPTRIVTGIPTLSSAEYDAIADAVWSEGISGYNVIGSAGNQLNSVLTSLDTGAISSAVWTAASRTLTEQLTLDSSDILTISAAVWDEVLIDHTTPGTAGEALDDASASINPNTLATAVWSATTRSLTELDAPTASAIATAVWTQEGRTLTTAPSLLPADIDTITANVWTEPGRTLSSTLAPSAASIATAVWGAAGRTLTSSSDPTVEEIATEVWGSASRTLTNNVSISVGTINSIRDAVWSATTRDLTSGVLLDAVAETNLIDSIWSNTSRTITGDVDVSAIGLSAIETSVWNSSIRSLTAPVDLSVQALSDISDNVWTAGSRTLTDSGLTIDESTMIKELWQVGGLDINNPVTNTQTQTTVDTINLQYTGNSATAVTTTRQP